MLSMKSTQTTPVDFATKAPAHYVWPKSEFFVSQKNRLVYCPIQKVACSSLKLWWAEMEGEEAKSFIELNRFGQACIDHGRLNDRYKLHHQSGILGNRPLVDNDWTRLVFVRNPWSRLVSAFLNKFLGVHDLTKPVLEAVHKRWRKRAMSNTWYSLLTALNSTKPSAEERLRPTIRPFLRGQKAWNDELTFRHFVDQVASERLNDDEVDLHWRPQYRFLSDVNFHFVGRFERLDADMRHVADLIGVHVQIPTINRTTYSKHRQPLVSFADCPLRELRKLSTMPDYRQFYTPKLRVQVEDLYCRDIQLFKYSFEL